ncbi:hypothetical protein D0T53_03680 [Dysgonomonas sp. 216]|uniref:FtsB family cell division protein n=1 Tax=Dysgonomonas sp. 216 TaxID=2302934 RepID=UPI0013CFFD0D|nr:septum formation initiator family protein [Dysgonomonas sp. 216]NDW18016.1 hypothetical protein [Dysgonomonas sp. 216]
MDFLKKAIRYIRNKFSTVQLIIIIGMIFFAFFIGDSNIFARFSYDSEIRDLKSEIKYYKEKATEDSIKLNELKSSKENIEKFARENYMMKNENEDIFVIE